MSNSITLNSMYRFCPKLFLFILLALKDVILLSQPSLQYSKIHGNGMQFTPNHGQVVDTEKKLRPDILYTGSGGGMEVYLRKGSISYVLTNEAALTHEVKEKAEELEEAGIISEENELQVKDSLMALSQLKIHRIDMDFIGANPNAKTLTEEEVEGRLNFYYPQCKEGISGVKQYNKIIYEELYKGIDIVYYGGKASGLKYDIIVKPHSDPRQIKLHFKGAENIQLNENQDKLSITTSVGQLGEYMPKVYQKMNGKIIDVQAEYSLSQKSEVRSQKEALLTFKLGTFNPSYPLIIDPWVTYYGGSLADNANSGSIATDPTGNVIFTGLTQSIDFPVSTGAFQTVYGGGFSNSLMVKMTGDGTRVFATYIGGNGSEFIGGVSCDANGNIFAAGRTSSTNFPTKDAGGGAYFDNTLVKNGGLNEEAIIVKFDPSGSLLWSTFFGIGVKGLDTYIDLAGNVIVVGQTIITDLYILNASQANTAGNEDGFIAKFTNAGVCLWSTYFGGSLTEDIVGIATDKNNNIFITGYTLSTDLPVSSGAFQSQIKAAVDFFISKFDPSGSMLWSTYYGGNGEGEADFIEAIAVDGSENVMICGYTFSTDMVVSANAVQTKYGGGPKDGFFAKFDNDGNWQWASYYGGSGEDYANGIAVDGNNNIIISGDTYSADIPITSCAYQTDFRGTEDQFIATFDPDGNIICSGYLGQGDENSPNNETHTAGGSIAVSGRYAYLLADSECNYPVTANAFQEECAGSDDIAVAQLCIQSCGINTSTIDVEGNISICAGSYTNFSTNTIPCGSTYQWYFDGGMPLSSIEQNPLNINYSTPGVYDVKLVVTTICGVDSVIQTNLVTVYDSLQISASAPNDTICPGDTISLNIEVSGSNGVFSYNWQPGNLKTPKITVSPPGTTQYTITVSSLPCTSNKQTYAMVYTHSLPTAAYTYEPAEPFIIDDVDFINQSRTTNTIVSYDWLFGDEENSMSTQEHPQFSFPDTGNYVVRLIVEDINGCRDTVLDTLRIKSSYLFYVPNSFTPNGDNINDVFKVHALVIAGFSIHIYDRWGNLIFETKDVNESWDGKIQGSNQLASEDVYVYLIKTIDYGKTEHEYNGRVTLIR